MPVVGLSFTLMSVPTVPVMMGEGVPAVTSSTPAGCPPPSSSLPPSGQSSTPSQLIAWGEAGDSSVPLSPNHVQVGCSQDVPEEGNLFHVSPVSPEFLNRPLQDALQFPLEGVLLPTTMDDFSDSDLGAPITYAQCELIPGSDAPMSLPVFSMPSGFSARPDQSSVQTVLALGTSSHLDGDPLPSLLPWTSRTARCWRRACRVVRFVSRRTADSRLRMGIQRLACCFITHCSSVRRGRLASCTVHQRFG